MADDMNNGQSVPFDPLASYARLSERVENQGRDIVDLRSNMNTGFRNIEGAVNSLATELRGSSKTQWPVIWSAIGVSFAILLAVGSQALAPIRENVSDVKGALSVVVDKMVTQAEMKWRTDRGAEDRLRTEAAIADIRSGLVPRAEHERVWQNYDQRFADEQRQIDEMKAATASVYNQRDIIRDILERLDRAEHRVPPAP
ncbi:MULTISPECIES: hypothetical protein [unclassified Mesorhizobium]|uniref:hypothetical protein n=2 Tax=unclassified Mesorhizobium TaxID=325217 RepID=UPI0033369FA0